MGCGSFTTPKAYIVCAFSVELAIEEVITSIAVYKQLTVCHGYLAKLPWSEASEAVVGNENCSASDVFDFY